MDNFQLTIPNDKEIKTIYDWETNEANFAYIAGKTVNVSCIYKEYYEKFKLMLTNPKLPYRIMKNQNNDILGSIKGYNYLQRNNSIVIGFYIPEIYRRKGYGTKIVELFTFDLFNDSDLKINRIIATTIESNEGSKRVLEKNSFVLEGKLRESIILNDNKYTEYYYSLLRNDLNTKKVNSTTKCNS